MKYSLKIFFIVLFTALLLIGIIWVFSSSERQYALNQYLKINQNAADAILYTVQDRIDDYTNEENEVDYRHLVHSLPMYDFNSITILTPTGSVIATTDSKHIKGAYINSLGANGKDAFFSPMGANYVLEGNSYYFSKITDDDYRIMCIILEEELLAQKTKISLLNVAEVIFMLLVIAICLILVIKFYKEKFNVLYRVKPVNNYTLTTTKHGRILFADSNFNKTFGNVRFPSCFKSKDIALHDALTTGNLLLFSLKNNEGEEREIAFNATSGLGNYKLVGSDVTTFMNRHKELVNMYESDYQTGFKNIYPFERDWAEFTSTEACKDGLMCFIGMPNLEYYRTLYGEINFMDGLRGVSKEVGEQLSEYGQTYTIKNHSFLLVKDKALKEKFIANIKQIHDSLNNTISIGNQLIKPDIRLGIIFLTSLEKETDFDYVLDAGEKALKYAKETASAPYYIQRATTFDSNTYQIITLDVLKELILKGGLDVYFKPQIEMRTEKVVGLEAVLRITESKAKDVKVEDFVKSAEKNGCIVELGEFIYEKAIDFAYLVQKHNLTVSISISPIQLMQMGFVEKFLEEYKKRDVKSGVIHINITEGLMIYSIKDIKQKLELLKENGIKIEIDDFGTTYFPMSYLSELPVAALKVNKAFVADVESNGVNKKIVKNIINIAKDLGMVCKADGVENKQQNSILKDFGCDIVEGKYYSQPISKDKVLDYINKMNKKGESD